MGGPISQPIFTLKPSEFNFPPLFSPYFKIRSFVVPPLPIFQSITHTTKKPFFFGWPALNYKATNSYSFILKQRQLENLEITGIFLPNKRIVDCFMRVIQPGLESLAQLLFKVIEISCSGREPQKLFFSRCTWISKQPRQWKCN